jgi:C_GCAxxG_C_C family probable redox protein
VNRVESAVACFQGGFSCSQAVLSAYAEEFGLDRDTAVRVAAGFGGGMGRMAGTCGAVTGALMVLGLKYGVTDADDRQAKEALYERVREFSRRFAARHDSTVCRDLLGCDISTPEGLQRATQEKLPATVCPKFVQSAAEILEELLAT